MAAKFELFREERGYYRFMLRVSNGKVIIYSGTYRRKAAALRAIELVRTAAVAPVLDLTDPFPLEGSRRGRHTR